MVVRMEVRIQEHIPPSRAVLVQQGVTEMEGRRALLPLPLLTRRSVVVVGIYTLIRPVVRDMSRRLVRPKPPIRLTDKEYPKNLATASLLTLEKTL